MGLFKTPEERRIERDMKIRQGIRRIERAIREQIASALHLIVHQERMRDGTRKITKISEVQGMEGDVIVMQDIFAFEQQGIEAGKVIGRLRSTGIRPKFIEIIEAANIHLPPTIFGVGRRF